MRDDQKAAWIAIVSIVLVILTGQDQTTKDVRVSVVDEYLSLSLPLTLIHAPSTLNGTLLPRLPTC